MKQLFLFCVAGIIITLSACRKEEMSSSLAPKPVEQIKTEQVKTEQLKVASDFNWKTFKDIQLTLTGNSNNIIEVASDNQTVYQRAYLVKDQPYTMKLTVPAYATSVHLLYMGKDVILKLNASDIIYKFN